MAYEGEKSSNIFQVTHNFQILKISNFHIIHKIHKFYPKKYFFTLFNFKNQLMPYNKMPEYKYFDEPLEKGSMEIGEWRREIQFQQDMKRLKEFKMKPYPGSQKGPLPEDDPQHYQSWFIENMPQDLLPYFR
jgi:hypothetical protein